MLFASALLHAFPSAVPLGTAETRTDTIQLFGVFCLFVVFFLMDPGISKALLTPSLDWVYFQFVTFDLSPGIS